MGKIIYNILVRKSSQGTKMIPTGHTIIFGRNLIKKADK